MLARAFDLHAGVHVVQEIAAQETEEERKAYVDEFLRKSIETQKALGISVGKDDELDEALGLMVNYRYDLSKVEENHEAYVNDGFVTASKTISDLAK